MIVAQFDYWIIWRAMRTVRTGIGFDAHRFARNRRLVMGGVEFGGRLGLKGHSDADVLCHAVMDAVLGAVSAGDIGAHFPDTDPKWKDADSIKMLGRAGKIVNAMGGKVVNVDATVLAEIPRLSPHRKRMQENIGKALGINAECVSVKATTMEGMGAIGRREGIAVMAVATVMHTGRRSRKPKRR